VVVVATKAKTTRSGGKNCFSPPLPPHHLHFFVMTKHPRGVHEEDLEGNGIAIAAKTGKGKPHFVSSLMMMMSGK